MSERVKAYFTQSIQTQISVLEMLSADIDQASQIITETLLNDGKILIYGYGYCNDLAHLLTHQLVSHHAIHRPPLPVIHLDDTQTTLSSMTKNTEQLFHRNLHALGLRGDLLIIFTLQSASASILKALEIVLSKDIRVIAITSEHHQDLHDKLSTDDFKIIIPSTSHTHCLEAAFTLSQCLSELVNQNLFPQQEHL